MFFVSKLLKLRTVSISFLTCLFSPLVAQVPIVPPADDLERAFGAEDSIAFVSPSKVYYPETWFHYIGGNVSQKGITADLEAIASAGFSGIQLFHGQFGGVWPGVDSQIACLSPMWDQVVRHTAEECKRLGLRFTMQGCPGWSMAGGPWIKPEHAMRHLVWSRVDVSKSSGKITLPIPQPSEENWRDYRDIMVLAFPTPDGDTGKPLVPASVKSNISCKWEEYLTGEAKEPLHLLPSTSENPYWIEISYASPTIVRSIEFPCVQQMNHAWSYEPGVHVQAVAVLDEGKEIEVLNADLPQSNYQDDRPITLSCREVDGITKYRISITNEHNMTFTSLRMFSAARKNNWESEAAWTLRSIQRSGQAVQYDKKAYVDADQILDITDKMQSNGVLNWVPSSGNWTVLRIGHVNTGMKNGPAPVEGTGWECDKFSVAGSNAQFDGYIGRLTASNGPVSGGLLNGLLFDSWECKTQTWTSDMEAQFRKRTDYTLRKWIPALFGYIVEDTETTTRFLNDWRRVLGDLVTDNFYGNMALRAKERGLSFTYETAAGDVFPTDILAYYKYADVPMCEFWQPMSEGFVGSLNFKPIKPAVSATRLYGKPRLAAESFTSFSHTWDENFQMLKDVANFNTIEGVTHLVFHTYTHNPQVGYLQPGTSFSGAGIGTPFLRGQTWWKYMSEFTTYLARCSYLLERGKPVSDVLWFLGDEIDHKPDQEIDFPIGFKYDYCNTDILVNRLSVANGKIVTPEGIEYSLLWLPETTRMLPETIKKLYQLVIEGATIVGNAPKGVATRIGGKEAEQEVFRYAKQIWGDTTSDHGIRNVGKGCVLSGLSLEEALNALKMIPDVNSDKILWSHRKAEGADWYYVCAPKGKSFKGAVDFHCTGRVQLWNPVDGSVLDIPSSCKDGITSIELDLPFAGSCFLVFTPNQGEIPHMEIPQIQASISVDSNWILSFPKGWGAPEHVSLGGELKAWKDLEIPTEGKSFSGTVDYRATFKVLEVQDECMYKLQLGDVERIAEVYINGEFVRTLWTSPYEADITRFVRQGENEIKVKITNTWFNRLVYDANQPEDKRKTWVLKWPDKNSELKSSGLLGPVSIVVMK